MNATDESSIPHFLEGFRQLAISAGGVRFAGVIGGNGPPLLLLHGFPQTHIAWRQVAPELSKHYSLVIPDLPGYGASRTQDSRSRWTKRRNAAALVELMEALGHKRFAVAGHDRGARNAYRLALDHPERVCALASLAVIPTLDALSAMDFQAANRAFHWFLLAQDEPLPEQLLAAAPDAFITHILAQSFHGREIIERDALEAYRSAFSDPDVRHAMCEDYRSAMYEDLALDNADRHEGKMIGCPVLVLWPDKQTSPALPTALSLWRKWADKVEGKPTTGGHLQPEDAPEEVLSALLSFFDKHASR
jgi:haloacetate dehalogenase